MTGGGDGYGGCRGIGATYSSVNVGDGVKDMA